jgi:hypothetical protein
MISRLRIYIGLLTSLLCVALQLFLSTSPLIAQTAVNCPDVGKDGGGAISGIVNTYYEPATSSTLNPGQTSFNIGTLSTIGATTPVSVGDLILSMAVHRLCRLNQGIPSTTPFILSMRGGIRHRMCVFAIPSLLIRNLFPIPIMPSLPKMVACLQILVLRLPSVVALPPPISPISTIHLIAGNTSQLL